jgi:hypothetical protein
VLAHRRCRLLLLVTAAVSSAIAGPVCAFTDAEFCTAVKQVAIAAEKDVGLWLDRVTRNGGMSVSCERKVVEFKRFTYAPSASMTGAWKESKAAEWNKSECASAVWGEAIRNKWRIVLSVTSADGGQAVFTAQCN